MAPSWLYQVLRRTARVTPGDVVSTASVLPLVPVAFGFERLAAAARRGGAVAVTARVQ